MPVKAPSFRPAYQPAPKEQAKLYDRERGSPSKRGYGRAWQKARLAYLAEHPLCVMCQAEGISEPATEVDHIIPHNGDPVLFWDSAGNWQALCTRHHSQKTRAENQR